MKKLTVIQPAYFPNIETLCQIAAADVVVWGDTFLYKKHDTINRTRIKTVSGPQWLSIPVLTKGKEQQLIGDVKIDPNHVWKNTHLKSLEVSYQNSPYYFFLADEIKNLINQEWIGLNELLFQSTFFLCRKMRLKTDFIHSTELPHIKNRSDRVVEWVKSCDCDSYLVRQEDEKYVDRSVIERELYIKILNLTHPRYHQLFGEFLQNTSGLDLLFNEGELSKSILAHAKKF